MRYRNFGATGLVVSEIGFGCARLGGVFGGVAKDDMLNTLRSAFDHGITFFDTADMYTQGESEALLGEAFRGDREKVIIASKAGYCLPARRRAVARIKPLVRPVVQRLGIKRQHLPSTVRGSLSQDFSSPYLTAAVERSLKRLRTDYLDLYQLHSPPTAVLEKGDFIEPLEKLKRQGKIRFYGVSCETVEDGLLCLRYPGIASLQVRLNLFEQDAREELLSRAAARGVAAIARECFAGGLLASPLAKLALEEFVSDAAERQKREREFLAYQRIASIQGRSLPQAALQFVLSIREVSVCLLGMRTGSHLSSNLQHLAAPSLSPEEERALDANRLS